MSEYKKTKVVNINPHAELCETLRNEGYRRVSKEKGIVFEFGITSTRWDPEKQRIVATTDIPNGVGAFMAINLYPGEKKPDTKFHKNDIQLVAA